MRLITTESLADRTRRHTTTNDPLCGTKMVTQTETMTLNEQKERSWCELTNPKQQ
jgi:hypothetical protein